MTQRNVILAGVPRSGSTLACHLLNKLPDIVALHEPIVPADLRDLNIAQRVDYVEAFFTAQRVSALEYQTVASKTHNGSVPVNPMGGFDTTSNKRLRILDGHVMHITKPLCDDFGLVIKQPGMFTGMLRSLSKRFECYATVRNPLSVLLSWNSVDMPVSLGRAPAAEACDPDLVRALNLEADLHARQCLLLDWYFTQIRAWLPQENVIRYEDVISSGGRALRAITPAAEELAEPLESKNDNSLYHQGKKAVLAEVLLGHTGAYWNFYTEQDIAGLL